MFRKGIVILLLIIIISNLVAFNYYGDEHKNTDKDKTLILYDTTNYYGETTNGIGVLTNLCKHFNRNVETVNVEDTIPDLNNYSEVMVVLFESTEFDSKLIHKLRNYQGNILWIGERLNQLTFSSKYATGTYREVNNIIGVSYKEKNYEVVSGDRNSFNEIKFSYKPLKPTEYMPDNTSKDIKKVYSYLKDGSNRYPYIIRDKNLYYVSKLNINKPFMYILSDVLHDFFGERNNSKPKVFIKIKDIHPYTDTKLLLEKAEFLMERDIPFAVSIIPFYTDINTEISSSLSKQKELIKVLRFIQDNGGSITVQGGQHYFDEGKIIGESYFDYKENVKGDIEGDATVDRWMSNIINQALNECVENKIYPIAFEAPHLILNDDAYRSIGETFDLYTGVIQSEPWQRANATYPWILENVKGIYKYIPQNFSFDESNGIHQLERLKNSIEELEIVSGYTAGISIDPNVDIKSLKGILDLFDERDLRYLDINNELIEVRGEKITIRSSQEGIVTKEYEDDDFSVFQLIIRIISILVLFALIFIAILFYSIFIKSKRKNR